MKYVKMLGLLVVAAVALMAFAGSALATTVTGPGGDTTPTIHAVNEGTHVSLHNSIANIECKSTAHGEVEHYVSGTPTGKITALSFTECTGGWVVHVDAPGSLEVHHIVGTTNGTLTSSGATVTATRFGVSCRYATNNTDIGTVTGHKGPNGEATLDIEANIPFHGGSFLCGGATAAWTGSYTTTETLDVEA